MSKKTNPPDPMVDVEIDSDVDIGSDWPDSREVGSAPSESMIRQMNRSVKTVQAKE